MLTIQEQVFESLGYEACCKYDATVPDEDGTVVPLYGMIREGDTPRGY